MKLTALFFFFTSAISVQAQFFSFQEDWFENESFFVDSIISQRKIAAIHIWQREKKDGRHFKNERAFLHYEFNRSGQLKASYKSIVLKNKIDTAIFLFSYNQKGQLYKQSQQQGLFHFNYFYFYENNKLVKEIKIDVANNAIDTTYLHYFDHTTNNSSSRITTLNALKKPFVYLDSEYNLNGQLILETKSYHRNQAFTETTYTYEEGNLILVEKSNNRKSVFEKLTIDRKHEKLDLISLYQDQELAKKHGFTYHLDGTPHAIIERNLEEMKITIYRMEYLFYQD